jgi:hypothetical protein
MIWSFHGDCVLWNFLGLPAALNGEWRKNQHFEDHLWPRPQGTVVAGVKQTTKNLTKGGVLHKRQASSLAGFEHSYVRNALLEMAKGALKL